MKRVPRDFASPELQLQRRWETTQRWGNRIIGAIFGAGAVFLLWLLTFWVEVGGLPYVSQ